MGYKSKSLEELFRHAYENHTQMPSARVLRRIRFKLWMSDFFSFKLKKLNVYYATLLTGSIISVFLIANKPKQVAEIQAIQNVPEKEEIFVETNKVEILPESTKNNAEVINKKIKTEAANMLTASYTSSSFEGCEPLIVLFNDRSKNAVSAKWDFGDGISSTELNPRHTFTKSGNYRVTLNILGRDGQQASYSKEVSILERPHAAMKIEMDNSGGSNREVIFKSISKGGSIYSWDFGDNNGSTDENTRHTYSNYGIYYVTLAVTANNGCVDTARLNNNYFDKDYELAFPLNFRPSASGPGNNGYYQSAGSETFIFHPKNNGAKKYELKIFAPNRTQVFSTKDIRQGWNGYLKGQLVPAGIYSFEAKGIYPNGKAFVFKGNVKVVIDDYFQN